MVFKEETIIIAFPVHPHNALSGVGQRYLIYDDYDDKNEWFFYIYNVYVYIMFTMYHTKYVIIYHMFLALFSHLK